MTDITLTVRGVKYGGWKSARVTQGIESICGGFELGVSERWANQGKPWEIEEQDECTVAIGGETLITGYVDSVKISCSSSEHSVSISGRDKAADLVDCSAYLGKWEFKAANLKQLAEKLCSPHGIPVSLQAGLVLPKPASKISVDPGDTSFSVLERASRTAGVLVVSDSKGGIQIVRGPAGTCPTALIEGQNIKSASASFDVSSRFRKYVVLGQHHGSNEFFGEQASGIKGTAEDPSIRRTARVSVIRPEGNVTREYAKVRAQWEATTRSARSSEVSVTVQGWTQGNGALWPVNHLVSVKSPTLRVNGQMLITQATRSVDSSSGTQTVLTLKSPAAFLPEPTVKKDSGLWREIENVR